MEYFLGMKQKTSVTLSPETLRALDALGGKSPNRSRVIEQAVSEFLARRRRERREARDLQILNNVADELSREVEDVLAYQVDW